MTNEIKIKIKNEMRNKMKNYVKHYVLFEDKILSVIIDLTLSFLICVVLIFSNSKDKYVQLS
jgi:hypothetical protein